MLTIVVKNSKCFCFGDRSLLDELSEVLAFKHPKAQFMYAHKLYLTSQGRYGWDGYTRFFARRDNTFPTGLLPYVYSAMKARKYVIELKDGRVRPEPKGDGRLPGVTLEDHQKDVLDILDHTFQSIPWNRGIYDHCTSSGKTLSAASLIKRIGHDTLYVVPKRDIMIQAYNTLSKYLDAPVGRMGDKWFTLDRKYTVATVEMLVSRFLERRKVGKGVAHFLRSDMPDKQIAFIKRQKVLVLDETHHMADNVWSSVVKLFPCYYKFGFSGTPFEGGGLNDIHLIGLTGDVFSTVRSSDLMGTSNLMVDEIEIFAVDINKPSLLGVEYQQAYNMGIVDNYYRNGIIADIVRKAWGAGRVVLIFVTRLKHGAALLKVLNEQGVKAVFLQGKDEVEVRMEVIERIKGRDIRVIITSTIWDEGVDAPAVDFLVMGGGGEKRKKVIQRTGRGLRRKEGVNKLTVVDFIDRINEHLFRHSKSRIKIYRAEGWDVKQVSSSSEVLC